MSSCRDSRDCIVGIVVPSSESNSREGLAPTGPTCAPTTTHLATRQTTAAKTVPSIPLTAKKERGRAGKLQHLLASITGLRRGSDLETQQ